MRYVEGVVFFKSNEPWFDKEKFGIKNNTVRILSETEFNSVSWDSVVKIEISNPITEQGFRRDLMDISRIGRVCGNHIVVFTWKTEEKMVIMDKNKNYVRGRAFEYKIATLMKRKGYFVVRAAGSHGVADLVAIKKNQRPIFLQCKTGTAKVDMEEHNKLFRAALAAGARAIIVSKEAGQPIIFKAVTGIALKTGDEEVVI